MKAGGLVDDAIILDIIKGSPVPAAAITIPDLCRSARRQHNRMRVASAGDSWIQTF